jgi:adenylate cyclase
LTRKRDKNYTLISQGKTFLKGVVFIGTKLISIITIIVLVSLGVITAMVSRLVRHDMQISAEENNVEINRRLAAETESALAYVRTNSQMLIRTVTAAGTENAAVEFFFEENPQISAVFFTSGSQKNEILVNSRYFHSREIDEALADSYWDECVTALRRAAAGETLLLNAAPRFIVPVLALFFPWQKNGGAGVLFSPEGLDAAFCFGANQSYLLNDSGDILIHADFELVRAGVNVADSDFARYVWDNEERNSRGLYTEDGIRYFRAFTKLNTGGCTVITGIEYDKVYEGIDAVTRRSIYLTVAALFLSTMLIWVFAKGIFSPRKKGNSNER